MATLRIDPAAEDDLAEIARFIGIERHSPQAARDLIDTFHAKCESYAHQPLMGEAQPDLGDDVRSFAFKRNYIVIYRPLEDGIDVLRVFHGARDYPKQFRRGRP